MMRLNTTLFNSRPPPCSNPQGNSSLLTQVLSICCENKKTEIWLFITYKVILILKAQLGS